MRVEEGVGRYDVGAGAEIGEVDLANLRRLAEDEQVVVSAHLAVPGIEARAAIALLVEPERLDHGAHGAVQHQDALRGEAAKGLLGGRCRDAVASPDPLAFSARAAHRGRLRCGSARPSR